MTTFTESRATESNDRPQARPAGRECRPAGSEEQCRKLEADRRFEAAIEQFLAVSRMA